MRRKAQQMLENITLRMKEAKEIINLRAEKLADQFETLDPEKFKKRKEQIERAQQRQQAEIEAMEALARGELPQQPDPATAKPLSEQQLSRIREAQKAALARSTGGDLYRSMVPPKAIQATQRLHRALPPDIPAFMEGFFSTGARVGRKKFRELAVNPMAKVMLKRTQVEDRSADFIILSDVSLSQVQAHAETNSLRASASVIYMCEALKMNYAEAVFAATVHWLKRIGKPLLTYPKKDAHLKTKRYVFKRRQVPGEREAVALVEGTNLRDPLDQALQMLKGRTSRSKYIVLITDGEENTRANPKTLAQLQAEADEQGVYLMVIALGEAQTYVPHIFKHYRFAKSNGEDIPDLVVDLIEECHKKRL